MNDEDDLTPSNDYGTDGAEEEMEGAQEVPSEQVRPLEDHPELVNVAESLDPDKLEEIGSLVYNDFTEDVTSRSEWEALQAKYIRLAAQIDKPINPPWDGSSDESLPILAEAANQFHSRALKAFFPTPEIIKAIPIGHVDPNTLDRAERVGKHMSWQCMVQDRTYYRNKDRLLQAVPIHGSFFTKTYRDPIRKRNVVENVRALDLVVPYGNAPRDIEEVPRKTHIIWMDIARGNYLAKNKFFLEPPQPFEEGSANEMQTAIDQVSGQQQQDDEGSQQAKILEQHRFLDLDADGLEEPYIVWVDAATQKVLRIAIRWEVHPEDVPMQNPVQPGQPLTHPMTGEVMLQHKKGDPSDYKEPVEYFTHYTYLENPDGFYGLGMGYLVGNANIAINKMLRQIVDAGTLANTRTGLVSKRLGIKKGPLDIEMGKLNPIDASVEDIKKNVFLFEFAGPNQGLVDTMKMLRQATDRLAGSTEVLTGSPDKVMQPTTVAALIEQGLMQYTSVQNRIHGAWEQELAKLYRLNRIYMPDMQSEYFSINDLNGPQASQISKGDYTDDLQVRPAVDPNQATEQQKISKAQEVFKVMMGNPLVQGKPDLVYQNTVHLLKAMGVSDIDVIFPPPKPEPPKADPEMAKFKLELDSKERIKKAELEVQLEIARIQAQTALETAKQRNAMQAGDPGYPQHIMTYDIDPAQFLNGAQNGPPGQPPQPGAPPPQQPGMGPNGPGPMAQGPHNPMVPPVPPGPVPH